MHPPPYDGAVPPEKTPGDYAYPPAGYGYPPPTQTTNHLIMAQPFPPRYEQTPEESRSLFACLVWPLALVSCFCGGIILALIPTFFAYLSTDFSRNPEERRRYRSISVTTSLIIILIGTASIIALMVFTYRVKKLVTSAIDSY